MLYRNEIEMICYATTKFPAEFATPEISAFLKFMYDIFVKERSENL